MKKTTSLIMVLVLILSMLWGCGQADGTVVTVDSSGKGKTTLHFFANKWEENNVRVMEELITEFMKENKDIKVVYESMKGTEYYEVLKKRMLSGNGDDVFMVNHDTGRILKEKDLLVNLADSPVVSQYGDITKDQITDLSGRVYMLPMSVSMSGLYCNMDLLAENSITVPEKLRSYLKPGYEKVEEFIEKGYIDRQKAAKTRKTTEDLEEFAKGEYPFMITGAWAAGRVEEMNLDFEFQVHPLPVLENSNVVVVNSDVCLAVNAVGKHTEEARRFVDFLTRKDNIERFSQQRCSLSPLKNKKASGKKQLTAVVSCTKAGRIVVAPDNRLKLPLNDYTKKICRNILEGMSALEALDMVLTNGPQHRRASHSKQGELCCTTE